MSSSITGELLEYRTLLSEKIAQLQAELRGLENFDNWLKSRTQEPPSESTTNGANGHSRDGKDQAQTVSTKTAIIRTLPEVTHTFSPQALVNVCQSRFPNQANEFTVFAVRRCLKRMLKSNDPLIELVKKGRGRTPPVYRRRLIK